MKRYRVQIRTMLQVNTILLQHDVAPGDVLKSIDVPPSLLADPEAWMDRTMAFRLGIESERLTGDRLIGAHTAEGNRLEQFGHWGARVFGSRTLREALGHATSEVREIVTGLDFAFNEEADRVRIRFEYVGNLGENPVHHVQANLVLLKRIVGLAMEPVPVTVRLPHQAPADTAELERLYGPDLAFRNGIAEIEFDRSALALPLRPGILSPPQDVMQLHPPTTPKETAGAVMRVLREIISLERPTAAIVAATLGMNLRTMQRHLAAWGLTFEMLLDQYRQRRALQYFREGERSITEIAFMLGYSDSAHFTRACKRWTGCAPRQLVRDPEPAIYRAQGSGAVL